ncbi:MAG: hypothetical protein ABWW69_01925 [Pyrodictiaceae archaeon]
MGSSNSCERYKVRVGEREIFVSPEVLETLHEYLHRPMSLEELASKLGLESWEEAYELIKLIPAWILWTPVSLWRLRLREEGCIQE